VAADAPAPPGQDAEPAADVSVVVPTRADDEALARLLAAIRAWPRQPREIVVADGAAGAGDASALCELWSALWVPSPPGRGVQLMTGASRATGAVLWFVHADAALHPDSLPAIRAAVAAGASGGCFTFRFDGPPRAFKRLIERGVAWRARVGVPYGDQAIFVTRAAFDACGGFAPEPLFEEVALVRALRRHGRFDVLALPVGVSERRWQRDGWVRRTLWNRALALGHALGVAPSRLARWYDRLR
jgi:rSAM/selenodomain-associated transferase 2